MCRRSLSQAWEDMSKKLDDIERRRERKAMAEILRKQLERVRGTAQRRGNDHG